MANIKLYAYFDIDTGNLLAFSNELRSEYEYKLEVTREQYHIFVTGIEKFSDWVVCRTKNVDYEFELVQKEKQHIFFKNNLLEKITKSTKSTSELTIHWDAFNKIWIFIITDEFRQRIYDDSLKSGISYKDAEFYITIANEPNFLLQTVIIDIKQLIQDKTIIPFASRYESYIEKINIFTRNPFFSYSIQEWREISE